MKKRTSIFTPNMEAYIDSELVKRPHPLFFEMEAYALEHSVPIVSAATGAVLKSLLQTWNPKEVWELGTGIGYSTLWMAMGATNANITTLDRNPHQASLLEKYASIILENGKNRIRYISSWVMDYMYANINEWANADLVFIDCDKVTYPELWDIVSFHLKIGARIVYDNVLWHGRLIDESFQNPSDIAVRALWKRVKESTFNYTLFPVGDGLLVAEKMKK
ncbi:MAG: O-methyltransferase [Leptospira sp.]|nr:O-methyltransferase [Leptospira sp.]